MLSRSESGHMLSSEVSNEKLRKIWNQKAIPVILRRGGKGQRLRARLPYSDDNKKWLQNGRRISPQDVP